MAKFNRVLPRECTDHSKHPLPITQEENLHMDLTRWSIPKSNWLIIFFEAKNGETLYTLQKQDRELTVAQIMNSLLPNSDLKRVGKTTRPFRYDLNQILCDYTVEVRNRFKGLDLIDRVPDELWIKIHDIVQQKGIKIIPMEKKCKKSKWLSEEALQIALKRREAKGKGEKERYNHLNAEFQRIARRDKKAFLSNQCKESGKQ